MQLHHPVGSEDSNIHRVQLDTITNRMEPHIKARYQYKKYYLKLPNDSGFRTAKLGFHQNRENENHPTIRFQA